MIYDISGIKAYYIIAMVVIPLQNMRIDFNPGNLIPYKDLGTYYPNLRITDDWGILVVENGALVGKKWDKVTVS